MYISIIFLVNVDAALFEEEGAYGISNVTRDYNG